MQMSTGNVRKWVIYVLCWSCFCLNLWHSLIEAFLCVWKLRNRLRNDINNCSACCSRVASHRSLRDLWYSRRTACLKIGRLDRCSPVAARLLRLFSLSFVSLHSVAEERKPERGWQEEASESRFPSLSASFRPIPAALCASLQCRHQSGNLLLFSTVWTKRHCSVCALQFLMTNAVISMMSPLGFYMDYIHSKWERAEAEAAPPCTHKH